jgi:3-oxoacyl-(acyl-carrier-protein) synthase
MPAGIGWLLPQGLFPSSVLQHLPSDLCGSVPGPDLHPWLKRKKDARLLPRAAQLALPAAGTAMLAFAGDPEELAIFVAVGREPPDEGEAEASLVAMHEAGRLSLERLGDEGRALYPPLLPLRTLPNMVLAHVAIQHGIRGENAVYAGGSEAGLHALEAANECLASGRASQALVGAAYSAVDLASARDRVRLGLQGAPGEGAVFLLLNRPIEVPNGQSREWKARVGDLGPVDPFLAYCPG